MQLPTPAPTRPQGPLRKVQEAILITCLRRQYLSRNTPSLRVSDGDFAQALRLTCVRGRHIARRTEKRTFTSVSLWVLPAS